MHGCRLIGTDRVEEFPLIRKMNSEVVMSSENSRCPSLVHSFLSVDLRRNLPNLHRNLEVLTRREVTTDQRCSDANKTSMCHACVLQHQCRVLTSITFKPEDDRTGGPDAGLDECSH